MRKCAKSNLTRRSAMFFKLIYVACREKAKNAIGERGAHGGRALVSTDWGFSDWVNFPQTRIFIANERRAGISGDMSIHGNS